MSPGFGRDLYQFERTGPSSGNGGSDVTGLNFDIWPEVRTQYDNGKSASREVLLILNVLVAGHHQRRLPIACATEVCLTGQRNPCSGKGHHLELAQDCKLC